MTSSSYSEIYFIAAMMILIVILCVAATIIFFRTFYKEKSRHENGVEEKHNRTEEFNTDDAAKRP